MFKRGKDQSSKQKEKKKHKHTIHTNELSENEVKKQQNSLHVKKWIEVKWEALSRVWLFAAPWTVHGILQARTLEWVAFQGIFPTQGLNPGLPCCRWILYQLRHKGSPPTYENDTNIPTW